MTSPDADAYPRITWTPDRIARFWDWQSRSPETYFTYQFGDRMAAMLRPLLAGRGSILDLGCGPGFFLPHLAHIASGEVVGADVSPASVQATNERLAGTARFGGAYTIDALAAEERRFDAVLMIEVLEHLDDDVLEQALATARDRLHPDGIAIFTVPNDEDLEAGMILCPDSGVLFHRWQHVRSWTAATLSSRLTQGGFKVTSTRTTDFSKGPATTPKGLARRALHRLLGGTAKPPHLMCVARRA